MGTSKYNRYHIPESDEWFRLIRQAQKRAQQLYKAGFPKVTINTYFLTNTRKVRKRYDR